MSRTAIEFQSSSYAMPFRFGSALSSVTRFGKVGRSLPALSVSRSRPAIHSPDSPVTVSNSSTAARSSWERTSGRSAAQAVIALYEGALPPEAP